MATENQKRKAAAQTGFYLVIVTAIVVIVNLLSAGAYHRFDWTKTERHTLSEGSGRLVKELKETLHVDVYVKTGLPQLDAFVRDLTDLLKEYERKSAGKFEYRIIEPDTDELRAKAKEAGVQEQPFGEASATGDDQASITQGYMGIVLNYGSEKAVIPTLHPSNGNGLEFLLTNKIREIRDKNDKNTHKVGVISGKGELKLTDRNLVARQGQGGGPSVKDILVQNFPFYDIAEVDLGGGESPIDEKLEGLIITQPGQDYTDKELRRIDEFLMKGNKSLVVVASAVNLKPNDSTLNAELNLHGLDKLLGGYGIDMKKDAVFDHGAQFRIPVMTGMGGLAWIRHPGIAHVVNDQRFAEEEQLIDTSFPAFFRMDELMFPFPSTLKLNQGKQPGVSFKVVARTTPAANSEASDSVDMSLREKWNPKPPFDQKILAATAEGKLKSAFAGVPGDVTPPEAAASSSRILVISSSLFLTNPFAYAGNAPEMQGQMAMFGGMGGNEELLMISQPYAQKYLTQMLLSVKNTLDWMSGDSQLIAASAKILGEPNLTYSSVKKPEFKAEDSEEQIKKKDEEYRTARKSLQFWVQWTLILGVPFLFAAIGLIRWRIREMSRLSRAAI